MSQRDEAYRQLPLPLHDLASDDELAPSSGITHWRCLNCGQHIFTLPEETPPDICAYCQDMTTWIPLNLDKQT